jgi:hypothetical protein
VAEDEEHFQLRLGDEQTVKVARTKIANYHSGNQPGDVTLLFNGKVLKDNLKLVNLRVGTKDIVAHLKIALSRHDRHCG